jgi:hypothetical protein
VNHTAEDYYRACAAEMMAKAQAAPSKAIRQAYLNLALNWSQRSTSLEGSESVAGLADSPAAAPREKI